ncbi:SDR family NAD(P)-dependent oxidoreductase [Wandonia haliotis]|uniref:SDR family NAD(P)-dependent oxidoreductase n=1 Tax=Wandonia haliotis TaxID=574963 RepID=A0ABP3Y0G1_9FLAO
MKKTIFITGATAGFGEAIARTFAAKGWNLILTGRRKERLDKLKEELSGQAGEIYCLTFDVQDYISCQNAIYTLPEKVLESIDVLVNNAGLAAGRSSIDQGDLNDWDTMIDTNIKGVLYVSKLIIPFLKKKESGHIINLGSIAGKEVYPSGNVYCATKHAVDALSRSMRIDLLPFNIKVTNIAPGAAETEFSLVRFKGDEKQAKEVYNGFTPLFAQDIADTVDFVVSRPAHVTINDLLIMPTAQANATQFHKEI